MQTECNNSTEQNCVHTQKCATEEWHMEFKPDIWLNKLIKKTQRIGKGDYRTITLRQILPDGNRRQLQENNHYEGFAHDVVYRRRRFGDECL